MTRQISESRAEELSRRLETALGNGWWIMSGPMGVSGGERLFLIELLFKSRVICSGWTWSGFLSSYCQYSSFAFLPENERPSVQAGSVEELEFKLAVFGERRDA